MVSATKEVVECVVGSPRSSRCSASSSGPAGPWPTSAGDLATWSVRSLRSMRSRRRLAARTVDRRVGMRRHRRSLLPNGGRTTRALLDGQGNADAGPAGRIPDPRRRARSTSPVTGAAILAANHRSFLDSIFLPLVVRRRVTFVAKAEYFDDRRRRGSSAASARSPSAARAAARANARSTRRSEVLARRRRVRHLSRRHPHARRLLHRGHTGVARLSPAPGAPIIPVGLIGTDEVQPIDKKMPRLFQRGARSASASRSSPRATAVGPRPPGVARVHRRGDVRDRRSSPATSTSTRTRRSKAEDVPDRSRARRVARRRAHAGRRVASDRARLSRRAPSRGSARPRGASRAAARSRSSRVHLRA